MSSTDGAPALVAETETLIVSDLHLGLPVSRPRELLQLLQTVRFKRLILLGDVFHDLGFRRLCQDTHRLLDHIRALRERAGAEVVWIAGNHDRHLAPQIESRLGIEVREEFTWTCGGRTYHAQHGDRFDDFVSRYVRLSGLIGRLYALAMRRSSSHGRWLSRLDRLSVALTGLADEVAEGVRRFASANRFDVVVCGHTHEPHHRVLDDVAGPAGGPVEYVNSGAWLDRPTFLSVDARGVRINRPLALAA